MYCVNCGVELKDSEKVCPLCETPVFHPDIKQGEGEKPYPEFRPIEKKSLRRAVMLIVTVSYLIAALIVVTVDVSLSHTLTWSGYVLGAMLVIYVAVVLPQWFQRPNPVIFTPIACATAILYLLYIDLMLRGGWFLGLAFPISLIGGAIITTAVTLFRYLKRGRLFVSAGTVMAIGGYTVLIEMFISITFGSVSFIGWSFAPLTACLAVGALLIVIGCCKPLKTALSKVFFL